MGLAFCFMGLENQVYLKNDMNCAKIMHANSDARIIIKTANITVYLWLLNARNVSYLMLFKSFFAVF